MNWHEAYRLLELDHPKNLDEVREAYGIQVKAWHPDRFEGDAKMQKIGTAKMKMINEAFKFIKDNWSRRELYRTPVEFPKTTPPPVVRRSGPRDIITVVENGTVAAKKAGVAVSARKIHEYLGDATITLTFPDHRSRELKLKVGESATVEFGRGARFEVRLLQVRQVYKSRRGLPLPLFYPAADLTVTRLA